MCWDDAVFWPTKFKLEGREFTYPEAGKAFRINPGVLLHRVMTGASAVDALANAPDLFLGEVGCSLGFLRVVAERASFKRVKVRCSRCGYEYETLRENLNKARHSISKRAGCAHCYKSRTLFRDGDRFLTISDVVGQTKLNTGTIYDRLRAMGEDSSLYGVVELADVLSRGRTDGVVLARRQYAIGERVGAYTVQGYVTGGLYTVTCDQGHVRELQADVMKRVQCGACLGRGLLSEVEVGGRKMRTEALARVVGLSAHTVKQRLRKGETPENILLTGRRWTRRSS